MSNTTISYQRLANKVAIVTGASSGIGRTTAKLFAREGAKVVVAARREAELATLVAEITADGGQAIALAGDVQSEAFAKAVVEAAVAKWGRLDIAFNNAGTLGEMGPTTEVSEKGWSETLSINLTSAFLGAKTKSRKWLNTAAVLLFLPQPLSATVLAFREQQLTQRANRV